MRIFIICLLILKGFETKACSCNYDFTEFTPLDLYHFDRIVVCKPLSADTVKQFIHYRALVMRTYWGAKADTITIATARISGMCGHTLDLGAIYLIYGNGKELIHFGSCSPTRKLNDADRYAFFDRDGRDSIHFPLNGVYKRYSASFLKSYFRTKDSLEILILEQIASMPDGTLVTHFVKGNKSGTVTLKNGRLSGPASLYFGNGKLLSSGTFNDNSKEGIWTERMFNTRKEKDYYISWTGTYSDDKKHGKWKGKMLSGDFKEFSFYYGYKLNPDYK